MSNTTAIRERPLLVSGPMVRAILDGRKTQTRRVVKPQPFEDNPSLAVGEYYPTVIARDGSEEPGDPAWGVWNYDGDYAARCPFGRPGDRLWVRESFADAPNRAVVFRADNEADFQPTHTIDFRTGETMPLAWRPSIHMPRWASRLTLELTEVRVERVQEITTEDSIAEGMQADELGHPRIVGDTSCAVHPGGNYPARERYHDLWNSLNKSRGYSWEMNPWVWVLTFSVVPV